MACSKNEIGEGTGRGISGRCIWVEGKNEKGRKLKIVIAAILLVAFLGTVKNRYAFRFRNVGDKR